MLNLTEIKSGRRLLWNGEPYLVVDYQHTFLGRGGAVVRSKLKNLLSGAIIDYTFQEKDKVDEAEVTRSVAQYLYHEGEEYFFMDMESYEQFTLSKQVLGGATDYLIEGTEITILNWDGKPINIELPIKMTLTVTEAPPGLRGDTASGGDKVVTLETGMTLTTPLFIKAGDRVIINTEKGTYVSRASE